MGTSAESATTRPRRSRASEKSDCTTSRTPRARSILVSDTRIWRSDTIGRWRASRPKSISRESTLRGLEEGASRAGTVDIVVCSETLQDLTRSLDVELGLQGLVAGKLILKVRFSNQEKTTRSETFGSPTASAADFHDCALRLLARTEAGSLPVRGLGVQLGNLALAEDAHRQLDLFSTHR